MTLTESIRADDSLFGYLFQEHYWTMPQRLRIEKMADPIRLIEEVLRLAVTEERYQTLCDCLEKDGQCAIVETILKPNNRNLLNVETNNINNAQTSVSDVQQDNAVIPAGTAPPPIAVNPAGRAVSFNAILPAGRAVPDNAVIPAVRVVPDNAVTPAGRAVPDTTVTPAGRAVPDNAVTLTGRALPLPMQIDHSGVSNAPAPIIQPQYWHKAQTNRLNICNNEMVVINPNLDNSVSQTRPKQVAICAKKDKKCDKIKTLKIPKPHLNEDTVRLIIYAEELEIDNEDDKEDIWNDIMDIEFTSQIHSVVSDDASEQDLRFVGELLHQNVRTISQPTHLTFYLKLADIQSTERFRQIYKGKKLDIIINKLVINDELTQKYDITKIMLKSEFLEEDYQRCLKFHNQELLRIQTIIISKCMSCSNQLQMTSKVISIPIQNTFGKTLSTQIYTIPVTIDIDDITGLVGDQENQKAILMAKLSEKLKISVEEIFVGKVENPFVMALKDDGRLFGKIENGSVLIHMDIPNPKSLANLVELVQSNKLKKLFEEHIITEDLLHNEGVASVSVKITIDDIQYRLAYNELIIIQYLHDTASAFTIQGNYVNIITKASTKPVFLQKLASTAVTNQIDVLHKLRNKAIEREEVVAAKGILTKDYLLDCMSFHKSEIFDVEDSEFSYGIVYESDRIVYESDRIVYESDSSGTGSIINYGLLVSSGIQSRQGSLSSLLKEVQIPNRGSDNSCTSKHRIINSPVFSLELVPQTSIDCPSDASEMECAVPMHRFGTDINTLPQGESEFPNGFEHHDLQHQIPRKLVWERNIAVNGMSSCTVAKFSYTYFCIFQSSLTHGYLDPHLRSRILMHLDNEEVD